MKVLKWGLGILVIAIILVVSVISLNNKQAGKTPVNTSQTNKTVQTSPSTQKQTQFVDKDAANYEGQANLAKFEDIAQKNANSATDQVNAARSSYVNGNYDKAAEYYKKALALDPKNAEYLNYLGNVYYRGFSNPKEAQQYYVEATQNDPRYAYGWWNLALCQNSLGNKDAAKETLKKGIASVDPKDPLLKTLQQLQESYSK